MDNQTLIIIVLVAVVAALAVALLLQRKRSDQLRSRFGPEYERAVEETGDKRRAEAELHQRAKRVEKLPIRPLEPADRQRFIEAWRQVQADFVDDPQRSIGHADQLLQDVMSARGYPISDFDQAAADVSVDHPTVVHHFRAGHDIALRHQRGETNTEDLRQAMIHYRELFGELVTDGEASERASEPRRSRDDEPGRETR